MKHIDLFESYLLLEAKPYTPDNFRLFTQLVGTWLKTEFTESESDKESFIKKLPHYDVNYEVKTDIKRSTRPVSLSDVEEQENDNFISYLQRNGKFGLINSDFGGALVQYGNFIWQLPRKQGNAVVSKTKKNFPELDRIMEVLIKRGTKPVKNPSEIPQLLQSVEEPSQPKRRGRKPGTKNKPKVPENVAGLNLPAGLIEQFKREGPAKIEELENKILEIDRQMSEMMDPMIKQMKAIFNETKLRRKVLGMED